MPKLQLALDGDLQSSLKLLSAVAAFVDIVEVGTPLIFREGMHGVRQIREAVPEHQLLADLKIMDAGEEEAAIAFEAGADLVTVLGVANDATIGGSVRSAQRYTGETVADMMQVRDLVARGERLIEIGCDLLCLHTAYDLQSGHSAPYRDLALLRQNLPAAKLAIAGGIKPENLALILPHQPDIIIVGGAIVRAENPAVVAKTIRQMLQ